MPIVSGADFLPSSSYRNGHYSTLIPYLFGKVPDVNYQRIRIDTPDNDFLDLDYIKKRNRRLVILCHGLEGSSQSSYMLHFADYYSQSEYDVLAMNYRGCSGEPNIRLGMYNSGSSDDLHCVIEHTKSDYDEIFLIGFSLGGNIVLKYLGEGIFDISEKVKVAVAISTPLHLSDSSQQLLKWENTLYQIQFLISLSQKLFKKKKQYPDKIQLRHLFKTTNLYKFDDYYTAPIFGYSDAEDYYTSNQSIQWLDQISKPVLIINAENDPFLGPLCYPVKSIKDLEKVYLCSPKYGGHVGFTSDLSNRSWIYHKTTEFIEGINN